jgi:hypothetical protein
MKIPLVAAGVARSAADPSTAAPPPGALPLARKDHSRAGFVDHAILSSCGPDYYWAPCMDHATHKTFQNYYQCCPIGQHCDDSVGCYVS